MTFSVQWLPEAEADLEVSRAILEMPLLVTLAMPIADRLQQTQFLTNNLGEQTDVVIPIETWNTVLTLVESFQSIDAAHWVQQAEQARNSSAMLGTDLYHPRNQTPSFFDRESCPEGLPPARSKPLAKNLLQRVWVRMPARIRTRCSRFSGTR